MVVSLKGDKDFENVLSTQRTHPFHSSQDLNFNLDFIKFLLKLKELIESLWVILIVMDLFQGQTT